MSGGKARRERETYGARRRPGEEERHRDLGGTSAEPKKEAPRELACAAPTPDL